MNTADIVIISIIIAVVLGVVLLMRKQKKNGSGCHSGCSGCSKANSCSSTKK